MGDYIIREAAMPDSFCVGISCQECPFCDDPIKGGCKVARFIDAIPAADVSPVRHGRWIEQPLDFDLCGVAYYQCSECGKEQQTPSNYCQFCGANEDAEEQGRLVILPCKIGDTVYFLQRCLDSYMFVNYGDVIAFHVYRSYITVEVNDHDAFNPFVTLDVSAFGKTVFLTREEAEAALKGGQDDGT